MGRPSLTLEEALRECGLTPARRKRILGLSGLMEDTPRLMVLRLLKFLRGVRLGQFKFLSTVEKTALLENFLYVMRGQQETTVCEICRLFFEETAGKETTTESSSSGTLPRAMTKFLTDLLAREKADAVREVVWRILVRREAQLASLISPSQIISALWSENPLFRNTVVKFLFQHFNTAEITSAVSGYTKSTGKTLSGEVLKRVIAMGGTELEREKRKLILANLSKTSDRQDGAIEDIWSDYLKGLSRFDLIRTFKAGTVEMSWVEDLKESNQRPSAEEKGKRLPHRARRFHARIARIRRVESSRLKLDV